MDVKIHPDIKELLDNLNKIKPKGLSEQTSSLRAPSLISSGRGDQTGKKLGRADLEGRGGPM
jgi:hypothetical protein